MKRIAVLTSGGDSPGMNAAIRAVVRYGIYYGMEVYGIYKGYDGLIEADFEKMNRRSVADILHRGGTILKTARSDRFFDPKWRAKAAENLTQYNIGGLIVIGGNGSLTGAWEFAEETGIPVIGIPGTIDNDLAYTDTTIGFDTAVNTVLDAISRIRDTSSAHERTTVIEVMGRYCGDIALYSGLTGGAEVVLMPEVKTDIEEVTRKVLEGVGSGKLHSIIIRAEGYPISSEELVSTLTKETGRDIKLVVLSYLQRGGSPTFRDRMLATSCGVLAVELLKDGVYNRAVGEINGDIVDLDLGEAIKLTSRPLKKELVRGVKILSM